jgi:hypothetical protein
MQQQTLISGVSSIQQIINMNVFIAEESVEKLSK